jgi:antitoxin Phd
MRTVDAAAAQAHLDQILEDAQRQPIVIRGQDRDIAVVLSVAQYERLRNGIVQAFLHSRNEVARDAAATGLTEAQLTALLKSD